MSINNHNRGFTLLEVMVAISIFAILGAGAHKMIGSISRSQVSINQHSDNLSRLERAMNIIHRDILQVTPRAIRTEYDDKELAIVGGRNELIFTRVGWHNPLELPRSDVQRIKYGVGQDPRDKREGEHVLRSSWLVLDRAPDSEVYQQLLIPNVSDLNFRYLDADKKWHSQWPVSEGSDNDKTQLPIAIEIKFDSEFYGELVRLIQIGDSNREES